MSSLLINRGGGDNIRCTVSICAAFKGVPMSYPKSDLRDTRDTATRAYTSPVRPH
jgi:hypothetical protein